MKTNIKNGIYIIDEQGNLHTMEDWAKQPNPESAQFVALKTNHCALRIAKNDLVGESKFADAQKACAVLGVGWRCPTRHEAVEMYDARFRGLDKAFYMIGGKPINCGWRWTCEADTDPEYSIHYAFIYEGYDGSVYPNCKYTTNFVRPLAEF